jgi:glycosyltransferase involved in cell wall biosynthesis
LISLGNFIKLAGRRTVNIASHAISCTWKPYSRLILVYDSPLWSLAWDMRELATIVRTMGVQVAPPKWADVAECQSLFFASQFLLLGPGGAWPGRHKRIATAYFHGKPGTGIKEFDRYYERFCQEHPHIHRVQVSHTEMRDVVLGSGIAPEKVFLIPIGINLSFFQVQTPYSRQEARARFNIPESAVVVGSFQKDGKGWGEGLEPKLIKGPDVFLKTIAILKQRIPELFVLLSGPARGYVKTGLERLQVPFKHFYLSSYPEVGQLFQALDVYLVTSRQEGGPKAVLEAMASGVPLVTTRVGQAMDLVQHEGNGWMVDSEDADGLAFWAEVAVTQSTHTAEVLTRGRRTAEANTYESQLPLWRKFMEGFVHFNS